MNKSRWISVLGVIGSMAAVSGVWAQANPHIGFVYPAGGQRGTTFQVRLGGQRLDGLEGAIVSGQGVKARLVEYRKRLSNQDRRFLQEQLKDLRQQQKKKPAKGKWVQAMEKTFKTKDKDEDGFLSFDEFKGKAKRPEAVERAEQIFKLIDADKDLKVSLKEFTNKPPEARFKQLDRNDDGKVTFDEYKGKREKPEEIEAAEQRFKRIDKDGDKELTLEEFKAALKKQQPKKSAKKEFQPEPLKSVQ